MTFPTRNSNARRCASGLRGAGAAAAALLGVLVTLLASPARAGQPIIWDDDQDGMDDRMETVQLLGYRFSFENADTTLRQRFVVERTASGLVYGVYVVFDAPPTNADLAALTLLGMPVLHRFESVPAVRSVATMVQATAALALTAVHHIEVVPILYGLGREDDASLAVQDPSEHVFPTWRGAGGADGSGVVVAILDTGINDAPDGGWPGHESLLGKVIGGASFTAGDSLLDTPPNGSVNPSDHGGAATGAHGTHVAGLVLGGGGQAGIGAGIAPGARAIDVKVIADAGYGTGVAEALDWCLHNRNRDWGAGPAYHGIDVINLSLSSLDRSEGGDLTAQIAQRAADLGIVVVAAMGNDGLAQHVPSPASADGAIAVGASDGQRTGTASDDGWAALSNQGPRDGDGDLDAADEQKPDVLAPGMAVLSADGDLSTDGAQYVRKSGTSMSAAAVSGVVALLRSEFPSLTPGQIAGVLRTTARRDLAALPVETGGVDPRWHSARGFGAVDLYAARLEILQPDHTQIRRLALDTTNGVDVTATIETMRERGVPEVVLERAPDAGGLPGTFAALDSLAAAGDSSLAAQNLRSYAFTRAIAPGEKGGTYWYRVAVVENGVRRTSEARRITLPTGAPVARIELRIVHNAYDHDLGGDIVVGDGNTSPGSGPPASVDTAPTLSLPGTSAAISSDWVTGIATLGNVAWEFAIDVPADFAPGAMPPTPQQPWTLRLADTGFLNRSGRIEKFRMVWHASSGDFVYEGGPVPRQTLENSTVEVQIPAPTSAVGPSAPAGALRVGPNPLRGGGVVTFSGKGLTTRELGIYDLAGRAIARLAPSGAADRRWDARDAAGRPLPAGVYLARAGAETTRFVVLGR